MTLHKLGFFPPEVPSNILLASKIPAWVFNSTEEQDLFESMFYVYDNDVHFLYFPSLCTARITFSSQEVAIACKEGLNHLDLDTSTLVLSYSYCQQGSVHTLAPPEPVRQFLISPPSSPPVGWEPVTEMEPHMDENLLAALEKLGDDADLDGRELELIPSIEEKPAVTLKMSQSSNIFDIATEDSKSFADGIERERDSELWIMRDIMRNSSVILLKFVQYY